MPRNISAAALAKLATPLGTEPINIIEIQWVDGGPRIAYSDRDIPSANILGRILELGGLDNVVQVSGGSQSQQINLTLDDTDGSIKAIVDSADIHKRPCWVYQWFEGLDISDKFLLCKGQINTPITWKEGDRTISFDIISKIEDAEVGFSIEEGDFIAPPKDLIGKPWPLCFGTVINAPAIMLTTPRSGTLATGVGISDWTLPDKIDAAQKILCPVEFQGYDAVYANTGSPTTVPIDGGGLVITELWGEESSCAQNRCETVQSLKAQLAAQKLYEYPVIRIFNGDKFPQGIPLRLNIKGGIFEGSFVGEVFTITRRIHPDVANPLTKSGLDVVVDTKQCVGNSPIQTLTPKNADNKGPTKDQIQKSQDAFNSLPSSNFFWAEAGATVTLDTDQLVIYVANILPSTILRVAAHRDTDAGQVLVTVPPSYYTVRQTDYVSYQMMELVFGRPLSSLGVGWSDDIFVTLTSSVGPNTVDVIKWLIQTYTPYSVDNTSFDHVRALIDNYPSHFMMPGRLNIIDALDKIAEQSRCAVWLQDDVFYIKYLPESPTPVTTITEDDIIAGSLELSHTQTEELVTKYVATYQTDYEVKDPDKIIYRSNVKKYGTHELDVDYFIYNITDLVRKSATFWLIRKANTWRRVAFKTPLSKLNVEVFDAVTLSLPDVSDSDVTALVEKASFDSANNQIQFECWTPIRSGERTPYDFSWPQDISETLLFPTIDERNAGFAGGSGPNFVVKAPANHPLSNTNTLIQGFGLECNGRPVSYTTDGTMQCHEDFGLSKPSDRGDTKPSPRATSDNSDIQGTFNPLALNGGNSCCEEAKNLAQKALEEARNAGANGSNSGTDPGQGGKEDLPSINKVKQANICVYSVKVTYITPTLVHGPKVYPRVNGSDLGDQGFLSIGDPSGSETSGFNTEAAADRFYDAVNAEIKALNDQGNYTVGTRDKWEVFKNYGPGGTGDFGTSSTCKKDTSGQAKMISFDKGTS